MHTLNARLIFLRDREIVHQEVMAAAQQILGYDICAVLMHEPRANSLRVAACRGYNRRVIGVEIPLEREIGLCRTAFVEERPVYAPDVLIDPRYFMADPDLRSELVIPIRTRHGTVGVFDFGSRSLDAFAPDDIRLCCILVDQMAIGLENIRLFEELTATRDSIIMGMARLAESRDGQMTGHLERICAYARLLAGRLAREQRFASFLDEEYVETISRSAALHDIGKVGIPDSILLKPGKLTAGEFEVMKTHATIGGRTLSELSTQHGAFFMLRMGRDIAFAHHEKWDGSGYPGGLRGDTIPLSARIVAVCDVYDALTSQRIYKAAIGHEQARELILADAERHFDPLLARLFDELADQFHRVHRRYRG
jgi:putative methionine-R-sulfoxide reductase with GAF domain